MIPGSGNHMVDWHERDKSYGMEDEPEFSIGDEVMLIRPTYVFDVGDVLEVEGYGENGRIRVGKYVRDEYVTETVDEADCQLVKRFNEA
jgi:hypothetical protein